MSKVKLCIYSRGIIILYLILAILCFAIGAMLILMCLPITGDSYPIVGAPFAFAVGILFVFLALFTRNIMIDYEKKEIRFFLLFFPIPLPYFKRISFEAIAKISMDKEAIGNSQNDIIFELTSGKRIECAGYHCWSPGTLGKQMTEKIVQMLLKAINKPLTTGNRLDKEFK